MSLLLVEELQRSPRAPGRQAAVFALGELGDLDASPFLIQELGDPGPSAYEAALALGKLGGSDAVEPLREAAETHGTSTELRTAAASALLDLGRPDLAAPLLKAVLLAGTPFGRELAERHGLPDKTRWALERQLCVDAIRRFTGGETFGMDPDSSWPRLRDGVDAFAAYLRRRPAPQG